MRNAEDPTRGIVDIETLSFYIVGYLSNLSENGAPRKKRADTPLPDMKFSETGLLNDMERTPNIHIFGVLWEMVPESVRNVLGKHYDAAGLAGEKSVDIHFYKQVIAFQMHSPQINEFTDLFGEAFTGLGPCLNLSNSSMAGKWVSARWARGMTEQVIQAIEKGIDAEEIHAMAQKAIKIEQIPASLSDLHDVVKLIEQSKDKAVIVED